MSKKSKTKSSQPRKNSGTGVRPIAPHLAEVMARAVGAICEDDVATLAELAAEAEAAGRSILNCDFRMRMGAEQRVLCALQLAEVVAAPACARWILEALSGQPVAVRHSCRMRLLEGGMPLRFESPDGERHAEALEICAEFLATAHITDGLPTQLLMILYRAACENGPRMASYLAAHVARVEKAALEQFSRDGVDAPVASQRL